MKFTALDRKRILAEIVSTRMSISEASKVYKIARKTIYAWKKNGTSTNYKKSVRHCSRLIGLIKKNPEMSITEYAKVLKKGRHSVYNDLIALKLTTVDDRINFGKLYSYPRVLSRDIKVAATRNAINKTSSITQIAQDLNVARKTVYAWIDEYKTKGNINEDYVKGFNHPRSLGSSFEKTVLKAVIETPNLSVHALAKSLGRASHGVYNVLKRNNLAHVYERQAYSQANASSSENYGANGVFDLDRTVLPTFTPNTAPAPPPQSLLKLILSTTFISSIVFYTLISWANIFSIGILFATIALVMGTFFFIYSLKYYMTLGLVLSYSQNGEKKDISNVFNLFLGKKQTGIVHEKSASPGLKADLDDVFLKDKPFVSVQVALFNEKNVVERITKAVLNFDYPSYEVILCDDSTDETSEIITKIQERYLFKNEKLHEVKGEGFVMRSVEIRHGLILKHLHRTTREGYKGKALDLALKLTDKRAQFVSIFDADFVPYPDTLELFLKYFQVSENSNNTNTTNNTNSQLEIGNYSRIAAVQGYQWHVLNKSENWITRGVRSEYSGSYVVERSGAEIYGGLKQISGSVYMIKKEALQEVGWGTSITEDFELTLRLYEKGYKVLYTPYVQAPAECVSTLKRLIRQRMRWAEGHSFNVKKMFWKLMLSPKLTKPEKMEFVYLSPYYLQAFFFLIGTFSWLISETIFKTKLPFWTQTWGWSLVLTNMIALPLLNAVGMFLEESEHKDYSGIWSFIMLSYIVVPFQAYAAVKGFIEKEEGPWFRTPKTGRITDIFARSGLTRFLQGIVSGPMQSNLNQFDYLTLQSANNKFSNFDISRRSSRRWLGKVLMSLMIGISVTLGSYAPFIQSYTNSDAKAFGVVGKGGVKIDTNKRLKLHNKISEKSAYALNDKIVLTPNEIDSKSSVSLEDSSGNSINVNKDKGNDSYVISHPDSFDPGKVTLTVKDESQNIIGQEQFVWGVLAINFNKSRYEVGETAYVQMSALDDSGHTLCNANLNLSVTSPNNEVTNFKVSDNTINKSSECLRDNVTNLPDYFIKFDIHFSGKYIFNLENSDNNYKIEDFFIVDDVKPLFEVERESATRINPFKSKYTMNLNLIANSDFNGEVKESIPSDFVITKTEGELRNENSKNLIIWKVDIKKGETRKFSYEYQAPLISPRIYYLGPFFVGNNFNDSRLWQIASDAPSRFYLSNAAQDKTLPSVKGTWTNSSNTLTRLLSSKSGAAATQGFTSTTSTSNYMVARWQTNPLSADTTFSTSDTVQYVVGAVASSTTNSTWHFRVHIFVIQSDGSTVRGTLLNNYTGTGTAFTTTATGRTDSTQALSNNVSAKAGDRIVVELGYNRTGTSTTSRSVTYNYGNTGGTDLTSGSTSVTTQPGWVEFSNSFTTTAGTAPTVTTEAVSSIAETTATGNGTVTLDNGFPITERGVVWNTSGTPTTSDSKATSAGTTGAFTASITGLSGGITYYVRAYAINSVGTSYGSQVSFTTLSNATAYSFQRKTWYDGTRYWRSYNDTANSRINFEYSSNGTSWTEDTSARISTNTNDFSVWGDSSNAYISYKTPSTANLDSVLLGNLSGYWKMNEASWNGTSGEVLDSSGNGANGTRGTGGTITTSGKFNNAGSFDGADDYVTVSDLGTGSVFDVSNGSTVTLSAWIYPTSLPGTNTWQSVITKGGIDDVDDINYQIQIGNNAGTEVVTFCFTSGGSYHCWNGTGMDLVANTWQQIGLKFTFGTVGSIRTYHNGVEYATGAWGTGDGTGAPDVTNKALWIGADNYSDGNNTPQEEFNGYIDDVRVYNTGLSATDMSVLGQPGYDIEVRKAASYPATGFSWGNPTVSYNGTSATDYYQYPTILQDSNSRIWVASARNSSGTYTFNAQRSTNVNDITAWDSSTSLDSSANSNKYGTLAARTSANIQAVWIDGTAIESKNYTSGTWDGSATSVATGVSGLSTSLSLTADSSANTHLLYIDSSNNTVYKEYTSSWQTAVTLDSNSGNAYPSISIDTSSGDLYAFWIRNDDIFYKKGVSTYLSGNWDGAATSWKTTGTNTWLSSDYSASGAAFAVWTTSSGSPPIDWDVIAVPEITWLFFVFAPMLPLLTKLRRKKGKGRI